MGIFLTVVGVTAFILFAVFMWILFVGLATKTHLRTIRLYREGFNELEKVLREHQVAGDDHVQVYLDIINGYRVKIMEIGEKN